MLLLLLATDAAVGGDCNKQQAEPMSIHHIITAPPPPMCAVHDVGRVKLTVVMLLLILATEILLRLQIFSSKMVGTGTLLG